MTGEYGPARVNVSAQRRDPDSLLSFITLLVHRYRECPELGWGSFEPLEQPHTCVLAHRVTWEAASLIAVHNLSPEPVAVPLVLDDCDDSVRLVDLLRHGQLGVGGNGRVEIELDGYDHRWLRVVRKGERRLRVRADRCK